MKWSELTRMATGYGWKLERHGHKHDIYKKDDPEENLIIERHPNEEVRPGLLRALIKQIKG